MDAGQPGFKLAHGEAVEIVKNVTVNGDFDRAALGWLSFAEGEPVVIGDDPHDPPPAARDPGMGRARWGLLVPVAVPAGVPGSGVVVEPTTLAVTANVHLDAFAELHAAWSTAVGAFAERVAVFRDTAWRSVKRGGRTYYAPRLELVGLVATLAAPLDDGGDGGASAGGNGRGDAGDDAGGGAIGDGDVDAHAGGTGDAGELVTVANLRSSRAVPRAEAVDALVTLFSRARPDQARQLWQKNRALIETLDAVEQQRLAAAHDETVAKQREG
jgi:hypothetical protein